LKIAKPFGLGRVQLVANGESEAIEILFCAAWAEKPVARGQGLGGKGGEFGMGQRSGSGLRFQRHRDELALELRDRGLRDHPRATRGAVGKNRQNHAGVVKLVVDAGVPAFVRTQIGQHRGGAENAEPPGPQSLGQPLCGFAIAVSMRNEDVRHRLAPSV